MFKKPGPVAQALDVLAQGELHVAQLAARVEQLAAEAVDLLALSVAEQAGILAVGDAAAELSLPCRSFSRCSSSCSFARYCASLARRISATMREGPHRDLAAAQAGQRLAADQIVERVGDEVRIVGERASPPPGPSC